MPGLRKEDIPLYVFYKDIKFRLQSSGRYYQANKEIKPERLLHRRIWIDNFGEIPKGFHVHHLDGDWTNNELNNLECINGVDHMREHMLERMSVPEYREIALEAQKKAIIKAAEWHKERIGTQLLSDISKKGWIDREKIPAGKCINCGKEFESVFANREGVRFCSRKCSLAGVYQKQKTIPKKCEWCSKEFMANKHRNIKHCSRGCAIRRSWNDKRTKTD